MKYVKGFFQFWRRFIIGDDWTLALAVLWGLATLYGFSYYYINAYVVLPIAAVGVLAWSVLVRFKAESPKNGRRKRHLHPLPLLMLAVDAVPLAVFRLHNGDVSFINLLFPLLLTIAAVTIAAFLLQWPYRQHQLATSTLAVCIAIGIVNPLHPRLLQVSQWMAGTNTAIRIGIVIGIIAVIVILQGAFTLTLATSKPIGSE